MPHCTAPRTPHPAPNAWPCMAQWLEENGIIIVTRGAEGRGGDGGQGGANGTPRWPSELASNRQGVREGGKAGRAIRTRGEGDREGSL